MKLKVKGVTNLFEFILTSKQMSAKQFIQYVSMYFLQKCKHKPCGGIRGKGSNLSSGDHECLHKTFGQTIIDVYMF